MAYPFRSLLLASACVLAAATPAIAQSTVQFPEHAIRADIGFLADDLLEGREGGTRGYDIAAAFVAARFESLGLQKAVPNSWYQPVTLSVARFDPSTKASITIGVQKFEQGNDIILTPFGREPQQSLEADAVFVGYGLKSDRQNINDYTGLDLRGKFAVVLSGSPEGIQTEIAAHLNSEKAAAAQEAGAVGIITIPTTSLLKRRPWAKLVEAGNNSNVSWLDKKGQPFARTPGIRATANVTGAAADALFAGTGKTVETLRAQAAKSGARPKGFALKQTIKIERTSIATDAPSANVIATLPGSDPALANEYVLLMAHLDHEGIKPEAKGDDKIYNGAMDNASGVATMLAVAKAFAESGDRPKRSILFAAVTAEEDGLLGSEYLAKNPVLPEGSKVVSVVNLDMPILTYEFQDVIAFGADRSTMGPIVARAAQSVGVTLSPDPMPEEGLFTRSDHYRFVREGVPSVFLMTGFAGPGKEAFQHFLKNNYHQPSDQMTLPFNWKAASKFAQVNYAIAREIANAPEAPLWYRDDFFGDTFAPNAPKAPKPKP